MTQTIFAENSIYDIKNEAVTYFSNDCPERSFMNKEIKLFVKSIIKKLPQTLQTTADLYFNQDLSPKEIAQKLSCPRGTVRSHLHRIRKILIPLLQDFLNEDRSRTPNVEEKK